MTCVRHKIRVPLHKRSLKQSGFLLARSFLSSSLLSDEQKIMTKVFFFFFGSPSIKYEFLRSLPSSPSTHSESRLFFPGKLGLWKALHASAIIRFIFDVTIFSLAQTLDSAPFVSRVPGEFFLFFFSVRAFNANQNSISLVFKCFIYCGKTVDI